MIVMSEIQKWALLYLTVASYLAFPFLAVVVYPMRDASQRLLRNRLFWLAVNVAIWCGYAYPFCLAWHSPAVLEEYSPFLFRFLPYDFRIWAGSMVAGWFAFWMFLRTFPRLAFRMKAYGCLSFLLGCFAGTVVFIIYLVFGAVAGAFLCPLLLMLYSVSLWKKRKHKKGKKKKHLPNPDPVPEPPIPPEKPEFTDPKKPRPKRETHPKQWEESVAVKVLILSGEQGQEEFAPSERAPRKLTLTETGMNAIAGCMGWPSDIAGIVAAAKGVVWVMQSVLPQDWQLMCNGEPMPRRHILRAGDTLALRRAGEDADVATMAVSFRIMISSPKN